MDEENRMNDPVIYNYDDGSKYQGEWNNGKKHGKGILISPEGDRYEGQFENDFAHGEGVYTWGDGVRSEGEFRGGKPWNVVGYDEYGEICGSFVDGKVQEVYTESHRCANQARYQEEKETNSAKDQKLIEYLPESTREHELIGKWLNLMQKREKGLLRSTNEPANNMSGDLQLDSTVASILLDTMQDRLPNYRWYDKEGNLKSVRGKKGLKQRKIQLLPVHLFTINWADSAPGLDWPESYSVTYVPSHNVRIVTTSLDSTDCYGHTDLAIGWCKPYRTPEYGTKKVIQSWWRRLHEWIGHPWADVYSVGLVDADRAEKWAIEVYGSRVNYEF